MTTSFGYDTSENTIDGLVAAHVTSDKASSNTSGLIWIPLQRREFSFLKDPRDDRHSLQDLGCAYEIAVKSSDLESGDLERRLLFCDVMMKNSADQAKHVHLEGSRGGFSITNTKEWAEYTLRRMSCQHVERVTATVRKLKQFVKEGDDALVHRDVLFIAYCGIEMKRQYRLKMTEFFSDQGSKSHQPTSIAGDGEEFYRHPIAAPTEIDGLADYGWASFFETMCSSSGQQYACAVAKYASSLIRFLIPAYTFSLGAIPDPSLWGFEFTSRDVEDLYHGHCNDERLSRVIEYLNNRKCNDFTVRSNNARELRAQMWNLAHATHMLLWGLFNNDRRFLELSRTNHGLLGVIDRIYDNGGPNGTKKTNYFHYLRDMRRASILSRKCHCANRPPWLSASTTHAQSNLASSALTSPCPHRAQHDFWMLDKLLYGPSKLTSTDLDAQIREEILLWTDKQFFEAVWHHCNDRVDTVSAESGGSFALRSHWDRCVELYQQNIPKHTLNTFLVALVFGTDKPTSDPRRGLGFDRMLDIMVASIRKLILDTRLCHDNVHTMHTKYWRYSSGERSVISIPYGLNVIVVRETQVKSMNNCRIVDIGMNLSGRYSVTENEGSALFQVAELKHEFESDLEFEDGTSHTFAPLKKFLLEMAWKRGGHFVLHGFCDAESGEVHEVKISVSRPEERGKEPGGGQFDDLLFRVRIDNEDAQRCTIITVNKDEYFAAEKQHPHSGTHQRTSFLRLGIQLQDIGIGVPHDHVVHETSECLGTALDGEKRLESANSFVLEEAHRSRAMQISPQMLTYLPRTNAGLRSFLDSSVATQLPDLMKFFTMPCVTILGLAPRDVPFAKMVLQDSCFAVIEMSLDDLSFATKYDAIKNLAMMSALSIIHLSILSPLTSDNINKLVNVTINSSLRFILDVTKLTMPLFVVEPRTTYCATQLLARRACAVDCRTTLGQLISQTSSSIFSESSTNWLDSLKNDCNSCLELAARELQSLSLDSAREMSCCSNRLIVVVYGDHSLTDFSAMIKSSSDWKYFDLERKSNPRGEIQKLIWMFPQSSMVVAVCSLDVSPLSFSETEGCESTVEPMILRPHLVVSSHAERRVASILGCCEDELGQSHVRSLESLIRSISKNSKPIPTFEGFLRNVPVCEFMSHWAQVAVYLHFIVSDTQHSIGEILEVVSNVCHNTYARTIWESIRHDCNVSIQADPSFLTSDFSEGKTILSSSMDDVVVSALRDGNSLNFTFLHSWLTQLPTAASLRQYIMHTTAPLALFMIDPVTTVNLLAPTLEERLIKSQQNIAPNWAQRLATALRCKSLRCAKDVGRSIEKMLSAIKWVVYSAGYHDIDAINGFDFDNVSTLGVMVNICFSPSVVQAKESEPSPTLTYESTELLHVLLELDSEAALFSQRHLRDFLVLSPTDGGITGATVESILSPSSKRRLGTLFLHVIFEAKSDSLFLHSAEVMQILSWISQDETATPHDTQRNQLLRRMTPAAWTELLIVATESAHRKWHRMQELLRNISPPPKLMRAMIAYVKAHASPIKHHIAAALHCFSIAQSLTDLDQEHIDYEMARAYGAGAKLVWPLTPLDASDAASKFALRLSKLFVRVLVNQLFHIGSTGSRPIDSQPTVEKFSATCEYIFETTTSSSQRYAIHTILELQSLAPYVEGKKLKWAFAALWIASPLAPGHITTADSSIVVFLSQFLLFPGNLQKRFAQTVKENHETVSSLALALIGWVEYVPTTMLLALSRIPGMWEGLIEIAPVQCHRFLDPMTQKNGARSPPYAVGFVPRPLPLEQRDELLKQRVFSWSTENVISATPQYLVSSGISLSIITTNLFYLNHSLNAHGRHQSPLPSDVFIGVKMIILWFALIAVSVAEILDLFDFHGPVSHERDLLLKFMNCIASNDLQLPSQMPPLVLDVQVMRPLSSRMMNLSSAEGRSYTCETLVVPLPSADNEAWGFYHNERNWDEDEDVAASSFVLGCGRISALRYVAACSHLRSSDNENEDLVVMYANDMLQPCLALIQAQREDLAQLYLQTIVLSRELEPVGRGALALAALSLQRFELLSAAGSPKRPIPTIVRDEIIFFLKIGDSPLKMLVEQWATITTDVGGDFVGQAKSLSTIIDTVSVHSSGRVNFPKIERSTIIVNDEDNLLEPVSIFTSLQSAHSAFAQRGGVDDMDDDVVRQHMNMELARKQLSGRSIDVSLILRLQWDTRRQSFYLTLFVTPGTECYLVERDGNLEISSDVHDRRVLSVFKSHGEAWNYCKSRNGPVSLAGEGFFLYRSKENCGGWRFFIGRSVDMQSSLADQSNTQGPTNEPRFHFWHVAAYHIALCIPLPSALRSLLDLLCEAVYEQLVTTPLPQATGEDRMSYILAHLVSANGEQFSRACNVAAPLLAYSRLLVHAAERMRCSGHNNWANGLRSFQKTFEQALAPQRVGSVYDAEIDVLTAIRGQLVSYDDAFLPTGSSDPMQVDGLELHDANGAPDPAFCFPNSIESSGMPIELIDVLKPKSSRDIVFKMLSNGDKRERILDCIRRLSSKTDCDFAKAVLSEKCQQSARLRHMELAFYPLEIAHTWKMLMQWMKQSIRGEAMLEALHETERGSDHANTDVVREKFRQKLHDQFEEQREKLLREVEKMRLKVKRAPIGEGVAQVIAGEIEQCWLHTTQNNTTNEPNNSNPFERSSPQILWCESDPDAFSVDRGEQVAFVLDALFCIRDSRDDSNAVIPANEGARVKFTSLATRESFETSVLSAQADAITIMMAVGTITHRRYNVQRETKKPTLVRLQCDSGLMLASSDAGAIGTADFRWELRRPSRNSDEQFFIMEASEAPTSNAKAEIQSRALLFRWVTTIIRSPMSLDWKVFFVHHMHVHSRRLAPASAPLIAYCVARLCPVQRLQDQLLGAINFEPNRYCLRRDRYFGVIVTSNQPHLESSDWNVIPDRAGPVTLSNTSDSEQYRELIKYFSVTTTHVIVYGKPILGEQFLKWCCEFTKRYPWRFIVFVRCDVRRNMPENRDRVVDLHEALPQRPRGYTTTFHADDLEAYLSKWTREPKATKLRSSRITHWHKDILDFVQGAISQRNAPRVILLVSPPGAGKTMELRNIEFDLSNENATTRFITFDCSGDALVQQALVTLLDNALLGIELGAENVVLVADEYHMLPRTKKAEFLRWAESKIGDVKFVLIANRDDADDEMLDKRLKNAAATNAIDDNQSIIRRARISTGKMKEALSTVRMNDSATTQKAVVFFSTIRLLISDDVLSLRMAPDTSSSPYCPIDAPPSPLELSLRAKLQPENSFFVTSMMQCFDSIYDEHPPSTPIDAIVQSYNRLIQSKCDPIRLLTFTAMLPVRLLSWNTSHNSDEDSDTFLSFVEYVATTSAFRVHPAARLASWIRYILIELQSGLPSVIILETPVVEEIISTISTLDIVDHPSFFPLLCGRRSGAIDLHTCDTLVYPHTPTLDGIYEALARHEALDWNVIQTQWARNPITSVDALLRLANPSIVAPETVLVHLTPQNVLGLLQREQRQVLTSIIQNSQQIDSESSTGVAASANMMLLRTLVLAEYPTHAIGNEGGFASPYFWSVWQNTITLPLNCSLWVDYVVAHIPSKRFPKGNDPSFRRTMMSRFVMWAGSHGHTIIPFRDASQRTEVCLQVLAQLAASCFTTVDQHAQLSRLDFIAPAMRVATPGNGDSPNFKLAFEIATFKSQLPHALWPRDMKLLARLGNRNTILTKDEVMDLFAIMGSKITADNAHSRVIGAMLQSTPPGFLPMHLQRELLQAKIPINAEHLCPDVSEDAMIKNVTEELRRSNKFSLQGSISKILERSLTNRSSRDRIEASLSRVEYHRDKLREFSNPSVLAVEEPSTFISLVVNGTIHQFFTNPATVTTEQMLDFVKRHVQALAGVETFTMEVDGEELTATNIRKLVVNQTLVYVSMTMQLGADMNHGLDNGTRKCKPYSTALIDAAEANDCIGIRSLAITGEKGNLEDRHRRTKATALIVAVEKNNLDAVATLLELGATVTVLDGNNQTPLHIAALHGSLKIAKLIVRSSADSVSIGTHDNMTPMMFAAMRGNTELIVLFADHGANVQTTDDFGNSALHYAATREYTPAVTALIARGANVNGANNEGVTPIMNAVAEAQISVVKLLLKNGANVEATNKLGVTPLMYASIRGDVSIIELLIEHRASVSSVSCDGNNALHFAGSHGNTAAFGVLVKFGADANQANSSGKTPLTLANRRI